MGRFGAGPGELSGDGSVGVFAAGKGRVVVPDLGNQTVSVFDETGGLEASFPIDITKTFLPEWQGVGHDSFAVRLPQRNQDLFLLRDLRGNLSDTLGFMSSPILDEHPTERGSPIWLDFVAWSAGGTRSLLLARMSQPALRIFCGGKLQRVIRWDEDPVRLTPGDVDVLLGIVATTMGLSPGHVPDDLRSRMNPPTHEHVLADVQFGPGGLLLVQRLRKVEEMDRRVLSTFKASGFGGPLWEVFSGDYSGQLDFGANVDVFELSGDTIIGAIEDSLGVAKPFLARLPGALSTGKDGVCTIADAPGG